MIAPVLIFIASFFSAMADAVENENFFESIFKGWKKSFWYKRESWKTAPRIFGYKVDAWHLSKSAMICCLLLSCVLYSPVVEVFAEYRLNVCADFILAGSIWNIGFNLFYHKIFKVR